MDRTEGVLFCKGVRRHTFDMASAGYVNLAPSKAAGGGDDAALIRARTAFLEKGGYACIADAVCDALRAHVGENATVLDAGCGEGYYAAKMAERGHAVLGLDLSKRGITHAAKRARREELSAFFCVAGIFDLPLADASVDAVVSLFAPVAQEEFWRVLKPGGVLILVGAGAEHLFSLKRVLYDTPYLNEPRADLPTCMTQLAASRVRYTFFADNPTLQELSV
jgi:23S rRNA (guanine745-N1)-methyltransferase